MRSFVAPVVGVVFCGLFAMLSMRPEAAANDQSTGAEIRFSARNLNGDNGDSSFRLRPVNPRFTNIAAWVSAVGAGVGSADLNSDGLADEHCLVDPRDDSVTVGPVPGTASTFPRSQLVATTPSPAPSAPMGCTPADIDADGAQDVLVYYWGRSPVIFYGDGRGGFQPQELATPVQLWNTTTATVADIDGDGRLDVLVGNYFPDGARVLDPAAHDDARMAMQEGMALARNAGPNRLYLQGPQRGQWVDSSDAIPEISSRGWTLAFGAQDLTGDLLPEVYVAQDFGPDQLLVNHSVPGRVHFEVANASRTMTRAKSSNLGNDSFKGMGVAFPYLEGSTHPSIAVSNITQPFGVQESNLLFQPQGDPGPALLKGVANYEQVSERYNMSRSGWSWDIRTADFNNDGIDELIQATGFLRGVRDRWPELQELAMTNDTLLPHPEFWFNARPGDDLSGTNPNKLWCLQPERKYRDCAKSAGLDNTQPTRSFATADVDGDGRTDVLEANQWAPSRVLLNSSQVAPGLILHPLRTSESDDRRVPAIGARVRVSHGGDARVQQLYPANGHTGVSAAELTYPAHPDPVQVQVQWRDSQGRSHDVTTSLPTAQGHVQMLLTDSGKVSFR